MSALAWGDGFAQFIRRPSDGVIIGLMPLDPDGVNVEWDPSKPGYRRYRLNNQGPWLTSADIFHIQGPTLPGQASGMSVIRYAREAIGLGLTLEEYGARYFGQGSQAKIVLELPGNIDEPKAKDIVRTFERFHKGKNNWRQMTHSS
jgi:phage portal protein BeeE